MADLTPKHLVTKPECLLHLSDIQRKGRLTKSNEKDGRAGRVKYHTNVVERSCRKLDIQQSCVIQQRIEKSKDGGQEVILWH